MEEVRDWRDQLYKELEDRHRQVTESKKQNAVFKYLETIMGDLFSAMRLDLRKHPLKRYLSIRPLGFRDVTSHPYLIYSSTEVPQLHQKTLVLVNNRLLKRESSSYLISERLVTYLRESHPA
jgi:hypothetical protein